jgi:hypothetical protein
MGQLFSAGFLVLHGLITTVIGLTSLSKSGENGVTNPSWLSWWPIELGRSWLFDAVPVGDELNIFGGLLWLLAGVGLIAAGLGWLGVAGLHGSWQLLALVSAALGLLAVIVYFHPFYALAVLLNGAIVVLTLEQSWLPASVGNFAKKAF